MKTRQSVPWDIEDVKNYLEQQTDNDRDFLKVTKNRMIKKARKYGVSQWYGSVQLTFYLDKVYITDMDFEEIKLMSQRLSENNG